MGRRVLTVSELTFHQKYRRNPETFAPADLAGKDLLEIFETWAASLNSTDTHNEERQTWVSIAEVAQYAPRVLLLDLRVGAYGEPGEVVDTSTGAPVGQIENHQAPTGQNRAMLFVPERGERAYFFSEESSRGSAGGRILTLFKKHFSSYTNKITMEMARVTESEAWQEAAKLTEIEVRVMGKSAHLEDGLDVKVGKVSYIAKPEKRGFFSGKLLDKLHHAEVAAKVVAVADLPEDRDVFVTMKRDGREKKFQLGSEGAPAIREVLNDSGEEALGTDELMNRCTEKAYDLATRTGEEWDAAWSRPLQQVAG